MRERGVPGSFWPGPTQRALLRATLGPADEAASRWEALLPLDVTTLPTGSFGLLPLLYERLTEVAPDEPQLARLLGTYRSTWYRNQLLLDALARLLQRLRESELDALVVGGAVALRRWYPGPGSRPVAPLELIVPAAGVPGVRAACIAAGWRPAGARRSFVRFVGHGSAPLIVHVGVPAPLAGRLGRTGAYETLRVRGIELPALEGAPRVLDPADEFLLTCASGAGTGLRGSCQWLLDAHHVLASDAPPPLEMLLTRARAFGVVEPLRATLLYLARVPGTPCAGEYARELSATRGDSRDRIAFLLAGAPAGRFAGGSRLLAAHVRASADEPLHRVVRGLPRHLQETWETRSVAETLRMGLRKIVRLLRSPPQSASARNRSASS